MRNWTTDIHQESLREMIGYLWYNGSTSFIYGEKLKRIREDKEKSTDRMMTKKDSHSEDAKRCELFMTRLKCM